MQEYNELDPGFVNNTRRPPRQLPSWITLSSPVPPHPEGSAAATPARAERSTMTTCNRHAEQREPNHYYTAHSFASSFSSSTCILYEMRQGPETGREVSFASHVSTSNPVFCFENDSPPRPGPGTAILAAAIVATPTAMMKQTTPAFYSLASPSLETLPELFADPRNQLSSAIYNPKCSPDGLRRKLLSLLRRNCHQEEFDNKIFWTPDEFGFFLLDHAIQAVAQYCFYYYSSSTAAVSSDPFAPPSRKILFDEGEHYYAPQRHQNLKIHPVTDSISILQEMEKLKLVLVAQTTTPAETLLPSGLAFNGGPRPLIRLFSSAPSMQDSSPRQEERRTTAMDRMRSRLLLDCTILILDHWPESISHTALTTGDTCLHSLIRHHSNNALLLPLVQLLLERGGQRLVSVGNHAGNLPLHMACAHHVALSVLQLIVEHTVQASYGGNANKRLIMSTNDNGWTALDLEFMRYMEGYNASGNDFATLASRATASASSSSVRARHQRRQSPRGRPVVATAAAVVDAWSDAYDRQFDMSMHEAIWQRALDYHNIINQDDPHEQGTEAPSCHFETVLFPRIVLLINAATVSDIPMTAIDLMMTQSDDIVHRTSLLCSPPPTTMPIGCRRRRRRRRRHGNHHHQSHLDPGKNPIPWFWLEYLAWKHSNQIARPDVHGKLPLHHAVVVIMTSTEHPPISNYSTSFLFDPFDDSSSAAPHLWPYYRWIETLLKIYPQGIQARDAQGRLPIHCFLSSLPHECPADQGYNICCQKQPRASGQGVSGKFIVP